MTIPLGTDDQKGSRTEIRAREADDVEAMGEAFFTDAFNKSTSTTGISGDLEMTGDPLGIDDVNRAIFEVATNLIGNFSVRRNVATYDFYQGRRHIGAIMAIVVSAIYEQKIQLASQDLYPRLHTSAVIRHCQAGARKPGMTGNRMVKARFAAETGVTAQAQDTDILARRSKKPGTSLRPEE